MRVYLPATMRTLATALRTGRLEPVETVPAAHAVTRALREWYTEGDTEELELAAMLDAALTSLRRLAEESGDARAAGTAPSPPRRLVLAADVPDAAVRVASPGSDSEPRSAVLVVAPLPLSVVVSAHVDEAEAEEDVSTAMAALDDADDGDEDAQFLVDGADGHDLLWYDATELSELSQELGQPGR